MKLKAIATLLGVCVMLLALVLPPQATTTAAPLVADLQVTGIEVSQGVQDMNNSMPLITKRRTIIRVYAKNNAGINVSGIRARIKVYQMAGSQATLIGTLNAKNHPLTVIAGGGQRSRLNDSFWFELPMNWRTGTIRIDAEVNYDNAVSDTNQGNDTRSETVKFNVAKSIDLLMVPLHVHGNGGTYTCQSACEQMIRNVLRYHPTNELNAWARKDSIAPIGHAFGNDWYPNSVEKDKSRILDRLVWARAWMDDPTNNTYYYGMLNAQWGNFGIARRPGHVAMGTMNNTPGDVTKWYVTGGAIMAHELGHNKGLKHVSCTGTESSGGEVDGSYPWPFPNCKLATTSTSGYYGLDVYYQYFGLSAPTVITNDPASARPALGFPMMGYKSPNYVSPWEYCKLMPTYGVPCSWPPSANRAEAAVAELPSAPAAALETVPAAARPAVDALRSADDFLMIAGVIDDSTGAVELNPFYLRTVVTPGLLQETIERRIEESASAPSTTHQHADGSNHVHTAAVNDWRIAIIDAAGSTVYSQTVAFNDTSHDGAATTGLADLLPLPANSQRLRILRNGVTVAERVRTAAAPTATISEPLNRTLQPGDVLRWSAQDADSAALWSTVLYSPDNGTRWFPLEFDTPTTALTLTSEMLQSIPGGTGGQLKVVVSDGFNTGEDTTTTALILANNLPSATIISPLPEARFNPGELLLLEANATDWEDGSLDDAALAWSSDRDGSLGTGQEIATQSLSAGRHVITLTATDSAGAEVQTSITVIIGLPTVYMPLIQR